MGRQVLILQDENKNVLAVQGNLKSIASYGGAELLGYAQLQRLIKAAKESGETVASFKGKGKGAERKIYSISWWEI